MSKRSTPRAPASNPDGEPPGGRAAHGDIDPRLYGELHSLAASYLRRERADHTLQPTALVHEAYLALAAREPDVVADRDRFIAHAAAAMRRVLVEHARSRGRSKRGGDARRVTLSSGLIADSGPDLDVVALDEALEELARFDPRQARVVELRFFGGATVEETARHVGCSMRTVEGDWTLARAWLRRRLLAQ